MYFLTPKWTCLIFLKPFEHITFLQHRILIIKTKANCSVLGSDRGKPSLLTMDDAEAKKIDVNCMQNECLLLGQICFKTHHFGIWDDWQSMIFQCTSQITRYFCKMIFFILTQMLNGYRAVYDSMKNTEWITKSLNI